MGAKFSRLADSINRRRRRSSSSGDYVCAGSVDRNGSVETGHDPAIHGAKLEDRNYNNESFKKRLVDPSDPEQNQAALAIQTQFRQHSAKQEVASMKEELAATRIQAGVRGYLDREQVREMKAQQQEDGGDKAEEEVVDIDLEDPDVEKAAIKIQAGFKGFKARKEIQDQAQGEQPSAQEETVIQSSEREKEEKEKEKDKKEEEEEVVDIDLTDPEAGKAALKIQAGFRGRRFKKEVTPTQEIQEVKVPKEKEEKVEEEEEIDIDLNDPDVGKAALKIQAGFRGRKFRKKESPSPPIVQPTPPNPAPPPLPVAPVTSQAKPEEVVDLDLGDPDLGKAALKIQAGFRGCQTRKQIMQTAQEATPRLEVDEKKEEEEEVDIDLTDPDVEKAAVKIQAGFKGFKARKAMTNDEQAADSSPPEAQQTGTGDQQAGEDNQDVDIDLLDPETEKAAVKIQAGFRGYQTRKDLQEQQQAQEQSPGDPQAAAEESPQKPEVAATEEAEAEPSAGEQEKAAEEEEVVDIDLTDPEVEKAATKIQAGFKGFKARKEAQSAKDGQEEGQADQVDAAPEVSPPEDAPQEGHPQEESGGLDQTDQAAPEEAAATTEEEVKAEEEESPAAAAAEGGEGEGQQTESAPAPEGGEESAQEAVGDEETTAAAADEGNVDLENPDMEAAAVKIQAGFKGMKARQEVKVMLAQRSEQGEDQLMAAEEEVGEVEEEEHIEEAAAAQEEEVVENTQMVEVEVEEAQVEEAVGVEAVVEEAELEEEEDGQNKLADEGDDKGEENTQQAEEEES